MIHNLSRATKNISRSKYRWMSLGALLVLVCALLVGATIKFYQLTPAKAATGDWPTYLHDPQRTSAGDDTILSTANAGQLAVHWKFQTGGVIAASPTVVGGTVYVGSWDGYEYALDASTGQQKWKTFLGQTTAPCDPQLAGVSSAAAIDNNVVYVGGGDSYWYALDATTGNVLWRIFTGDNTKGYYNWSSPLIYNGFAYIGIASVGDCPLVQGQLLKVDLNTHQIVNTFNVVPPGQLGGGIWTSPSLDTTTNTIFMASGTRNTASQTLAEAFLAVDATTLTLKSSWSLPAAAQVPDSDFGTSAILFNDANNTPLVSAINKNGYAYTFNRNNLAAGPIWSSQIAVGGACPQCGDGSVSSGAFGNGTLFLAGGRITINGQGYGGSVDALDPATGNYLWRHGVPGNIIPALAYSNGLVIDGSGKTLEVLDAATGTRLYSYTTGGLLYAAASVSNGQIFTGGIDGNVYAFGLPATPAPTPTPDPNCASGWSCQDIGNPVPAGSETVSGNAWSVQAGGATVGGTSDQFRFIAQNLSGDTQLSVQIVSQQSSGTTAQTGLMARQTNDANSPYYAALLTNSNTLLVQYRTAFGGATSIAVQLANSTPSYLEIQRIGDQFQTAISNDGVNYTPVPGSTVIVLMPASLQAGLAVSSGISGNLNTASVSAVSIGSPIAFPQTPCPNGWSCADIGAPNIAGSQALNGGTWSIEGNGKDIWNAGDQFHYVWQTLTGDGGISARVVAQPNADGYAKAGVMLRQSTDPASPYYFAAVTPASGILIESRLSQDAYSKQIIKIAGKAPAYLQVVRTGNVFNAYTSADGVNWSLVNGSTISLGMSGPLLAGLAVTSHNSIAMPLITIDSVNVGTVTSPPPSGCPTNWNCGDIGNPALAGSQVLNGGTWALQGAGTDIWNGTDQFHFVWQSLTGDSKVSARIVSQTNTSAWAKAGVMLRQNSNAASPFYFAFVTPTNGINVQYRTTQGSNVQQLIGLAGTPPTYLMVANSGGIYTTYTSTNGVTWTAVAGSTITLPMSGTMLAGLVVLSHNSGALSTVVFDTVNISVSVPTPPSTCPTSWNCADIGNPALTGTQTFDGTTWSIQGGGTDVWNGTDQFHFVWQPLTSDGGINAHIVSQTNTSTWAKAGVMLRQSTDPGSIYYFAFVTPTNGINIQYRTSQGGNAQQLVALAGTLPTYLRVAHSGNTFTAYTSTDGNTWTVVAGSTITLNMSGTILAGLAVLSHNAGTLGTVTFDTVSALVPPPSSSCPTNWNCGDIGSPALAGSQVINGNTWNVQGGGSDIWNGTDQFHYIWQSLPADGGINAHIVSQTNTNAWAKAGVMLRQSNNAGSAYYFAFVTPTNGINIQYRTAQGSNASQLLHIAGTTPTYLRVAHVGNTYTTYSSTDGVTWTAVAGSSVTLTMTGPLMAGTVVLSHNAAALSTVVFDTVSIS